MKYSSDHFNGKIFLNPVPIRTHLDLKAKFLMPIHWGTFNLAFHPWTEPVERVIKAAKENNVQLILPAPGETRNADDGAYNSKWWEGFI